VAEFSELKDFAIVLEHVWLCDDKKI